MYVVMQRVRLDESKRTMPTGVPPRLETRNIGNLLRSAKLDKCLNGCLCWSANGFGNNAHYILCVQHISKKAFYLHL